MKPQRIQLSRRRGWRMPPNTASVARPGPCGNPFKIEDVIELGYARTRESAQRVVVDCFSDWISGSETWWTGPESAKTRTAILDRVPDLRGKNLACWCHLCDEHKDGKPLGIICEKCQPCHSDPLLDLANR